MDNVIIKLARNRVIESSRESAILFLNLCEQQIGQQWQIRYYRDESQEEIDTLVAIGVKNGTGSDCYRVISYGTATAIVSITETLPDVSELAHGEIYIVKVEGVWNYVTLVDETRFIDPIIGGPYAYYCLRDGHVWYFTEHPEGEPGVMRRDDNFYTREELDEFMEETVRHLQEIDGRLDEHDRLLAEHRAELDYDAEWLKNLDNDVFPLVISVSASPTSTIWTSGTSHNITFNFKAEKIQRLGLSPEPLPDVEPKIDVTSECKFYYKLSTESEYHEVSGSSITLTGITGENKILTYNFKGGNLEKYGRMKEADNIEYKFGNRFLYGVTSGTISNINSLSTSSIIMKSEYYQATFTTTLSNLSTFAIPVSWGELKRITDEGGINYTTSFAKIGTFTRTFDGQSISYNVYRWSSLPTVATNFTYRFYN